MQSVIRVLGPLLTAEERKRLLPYHLKPNKGGLRDHLEKSDMHQTKFVRHIGLQYWTTVDS